MMLLKHSSRGNSDSMCKAEFCNSIFLNVTSVVKMCPSSPPLLSHCAHGTYKCTMTQALGAVASSRTRSALLCF